MTQEGFKRKLTAILSADAVGYSRLMGEDKAATVQTLTSYRNVISTLIKQHNGSCRHNVEKKYIGNNGFLIEIAEGKEVRDKVSKRRGISP